MKLEIPNFDTKKELIDFIVANKTTLENQKKSAIKLADGLGLSTMVVGGIASTIKADGGSVAGDPNELQVKAVINTTNIYDSHGDVHIPKLWNKSLKENKRILHVQEHKSHEFDKIIASGEDLKASVKTYSWKDLGLDAEGSTQALVFDSTVKMDRNKFMFDQYKEGRVDNHSVGMRYVKMELAVNDEDYNTEKEVWDKYITQVVNKEDAEKAGYMWIVLEAKVIEGSAVPLGSNPITPTINIKSEPSVLDMIGKMGTQNKKAVNDTFDIMNAINKQNINLKNS